MYCELCGTRRTSWNSSAGCFVSERLARPSRRVDDIYGIWYPAQHHTICMVQSVFRSSNLRADFGGITILKKKNILFSNILYFYFIYFFCFFFVQIVFQLFLVFFFCTFLHICEKSFILLTKNWIKYLICNLFTKLSNDSMYQEDSKRRNSEEEHRFFHPCTF